MPLDLRLLVARSQVEVGADRTGRFVQPLEQELEGLVVPEGSTDGTPGARRRTPLSKPVRRFQNSHSVSYAGPGTSRQTWSTTGGGGASDAGVGDQAEHEPARRRQDDVAELVPLLHRCPEGLCLVDRGVEVLDVHVEMQLRRVRAGSAAPSGVRRPRAARTRRTRRRARAAGTRRTR